MAVDVIERAILVCLAGSLAWANDPQLYGSWKNHTWVRLWSNGPLVIPDMWWSAVEHCADGSEATFDLTLCDPDDRCRAESAGTHLNFTLRPGLPRWSRYTLEVMARCPGDNVSLVGMQTFDTGPGELLSLTNVSSSPRDHAAMISWQEQTTVSQPATQVIIKVYKRLINGNLVPVMEKFVDKYAEEYLVRDLTPGVKYLASLSLTCKRQEVRYTSQPTNVTFQCLPPNANRYPPPTIDRVQVNEVNDKISANITVLKPESVSDLLTVAGYVLGVRYQNGGSLPGVGPVSTTRLSAVFNDLPHFSQLTAYAHVVYAVADDAVLSPPALKHFVVYGKGLEPLVIDKLEPMSATTAFVLWSHRSAVDGGSVKYRVRCTPATAAVQANGTVEMEVVGNTYIQLTRLQPATAYNVTVTAHAQREDGTDSAKTSAVGSLKTLPAGALKANLSCSGVVSAELKLHWTVTLPPSSNACRFIVMNCGEGPPCHNTTIAQASQRAALVPAFPFQHNTITMLTRCQLFRYVEQAVSNTVKVFALYAPSEVDDLFARGVSASEITVKYAVNSLEARYVAGYHVRWAPKGADPAANWTNVDTPRRHLVVRDLKPNTAYTIGVRAYIATRDTRLMGDERFISATTDIPMPPPVSNMRVAQIPHTRDLVISWTAPQYSFGALNYSLRVTCPRWATTKTANGTTTNVTVTADDGDVCLVRLQSTVFSPSNVTLFGPLRDARIRFRGIPPPQRIELVHREPRLLRLRVVPPTNKNANTTFKYQLGLTGKEYQRAPQRGNTFNLAGLEPFDYYWVKARVCSDHMCGDDLNLRFQTNVGRPDVVKALQLQLDKTNGRRLVASWSHPARWRGRLDAYLVLVFPTAKADDALQFVLPRTTTFNVTVDDEFTWYGVKVAGVNYDINGASAGNVTSYFSVRYVQTRGERPPPPRQLWRSTPTSRSVNVGWRPPVVHVNCYLVRLYALDDEDDNNDQHHHHSPSTGLPVPSNDATTASYLLSQSNGLSTGSNSNSNNNRGKKNSNYNSVVSTNNNYDNNDGYYDNDSNYNDNNSVNDDNDDDAKTRDGHAGFARRAIAELDDSLYVTSSSVSIDALRPHTTYNVTVASCFAGGNASSVAAAAATGGGGCGNTEPMCGHVVWITVSTTVGHPSKPQNVSATVSAAKNTSATSPLVAEIAWLPPATANGPIDGFCYAVVDAGDPPPSRHQWRFVSPLTLNVTEPLAVASGSASVHVYVRAFNIDGMTHELLYSDAVRVIAGGSASRLSALLWQVPLGVIVVVACCVAAVGLWRRFASPYVPLLLLNRGSGDRSTLVTDTNEPVGEENQQGLPESPVP